MKIREVGDYLAQVSPFIEKEHTCDGWLYGDPDRTLEGIAVTWMGTVDSISKAGDKRVNLLVVHEPLFCPGADRGPVIPSASKPINIARRKLLDENGLVVYRCHDGWDTQPEVGIVDSWAAALGLGPRIAGDTGAPVYRIPSATLQELAKRVNMMMDLDGVRMVGDPARTISKVGLGIGAWGSINIVERLLLAGADVMIVGEAVDWASIRPAIDCGMAIIETSHATSENFGVKNMAERLRRVFPSVPVHYIEVGCPWVMVK